MPVLRLPGNDRGYTLVELLVVIAIAMTMFGMGYSGFSGLQRREQVTAATNQLVGHLKEARMLAMEKHTGHRILFNGNQYTVSPYSDPASAFTTASTIIEQVDVSKEFDGVSMTPPASFCFDIKGMPKSQPAAGSECGEGAFFSGTVTLTKADARQCTVRVSNLGRINVSCQDL